MQTPQYSTAARKKKNYLSSSQDSGENLFPLSDPDAAENMSKSTSSQNGCFNFLNNCIYYSI